MTSQDADDKSEYLSR